MKQLFRAGSNNYALDVTNISEDERGDLSQHIHELQDTCWGMEKVDGRDVGLVAGGPGHLAVSILRDQGYDVSLLDEFGQPY